MLNLNQERGDCLNSLEIEIEIAICRLRNKQIHPKLNLYMKTSMQLSERVSLALEENSTEA